MTIENFPFSTTPSSWREVGQALMQIKRATLLHKYNATANPSSSTDDATLGYEIGSLWVNTSTDAVYICADATDGAAVWTLVGAPGGGSAPLAASYVTMSADGTLTSERVLTTTTSIVVVDGGAGTTVTLQRAALTGDATASQNSNALTLATVNANVGTFGTATQVGTFTVNGKGLITAASNTTIAIPSSAVTPPGSDTQVIFNDGGAFGADASLVYNKTTDTLSTENISNIAGNPLAIFTQDATTPNDVVLTGGEATSGDNTGGGVEFAGGDGSGTGTGGSMAFGSGAGGATGAGGNVSFQAGEGGGTSGAGGNVSFQAGTANAGDSDGGSISLFAGAATGAGTKGKIVLQDGGSTVSAILDTATLATSDKTFTFPNVSGTLAITANSAGVPTQVAVADTTDSTCFVGLFEDATGNLAPKTDGALTYNASTGALTATSFVGALTGNAATVTVADTTDSTCFVGLFEDATGSLAPKTDGGLLYNASTGLLSATLLKSLGNMEIGNDAAGVDYTLTFKGADSDGVLTWMEDEDYFLFSDDILMSTTEKIQFHDTAIFIHAPSDGNLLIQADTLVTIGVDGDTTFGDDTLRLVSPFEDLKINFGSSSLRFNDGWFQNLHVQQSVANVSNPPTDAELDGAFGTPASLGRGFVGTVDDNSSDTTLLFWLCITSDASWYYLPMTKAV